MRFFKSSISVAKHKIAINSLATVIAKLASCSIPLKREPCPIVIFLKVRSLTSIPRFNKIRLGSSSRLLS